MTQVHLMNIKRELRTCLQDNVNILFKIEGLSFQNIKNANIFYSLFVMHV